jgi:hypothetical protein
MAGQNHCFFRERQQFLLNALHQLPMVSSGQVSTADAEFEQSIAYNNKSFGRKIESQTSR